MKKLAIIGVLIILSVIYFSFQTLSIICGDGGDLVTASYTIGIPHPPGFPLYTFLGSLIAHLPFFTPAWVVGLLSSIPAIITRIVLLVILIDLTKSYFYSIIGIIIFSFLYPVWLFSEVPEVVSFNIFFITLLIYLALEFNKNKNKKFLVLMFLTSGIAFFHSYIVVIIFPGLIYLFYSRKTRYLIKNNIKMLTLAFFTGLIPYVYAIIASSRFPHLDIEHATDPVGLLKLITRSSYGTFRLSSNIYFNPSNAINSMANLLNFIRIDFKMIGIVFFTLGIIYMFKKSRRLFYFFAINLLSTIIFFAYASFPMTLPLHWGTFEKYLPIPYLYIIIFIVFGMIFFSEIINKIIKHRLLKIISIFALSFTCVIYSLIIFTNNFKRMYALRTDFTAENLGRDLLTSIPKNGIVNLSNDTSLYDTYYVHFVLKERTDVKIIYFSLLKDKFYRIYLKRNFPDIYLPDEKKPEYIFLKEFLDENAKKYPILNSGPSQLVDEVWLPHGLLWMYYPSFVELPLPKKLIYDNLVLWQAFHSPLTGSLGKYQTLLLSDVLRVYALGHQSFGMMLYKNKEYQLAANEFKEAINYLPEIVDNYLNLAKTFIDWKKCLEAEKILKKAIKLYKNNKNIYKEFIALYGICYENEQKVKDYYYLYNRLK